MPFLGLITSAQYQQELSQVWSMLDAAKQRELELLAVIEKLRKEQMDAALDKFVQDSSQALREHEAKVLVTAGDKLDDLWVRGKLQTKGAGNELRCMAEERRLR